MDNGYSLSDIATAAGDGGFGGANAWVLIILFALIFGNGAFGGMNTSERVATSADVQRSTDFAALERQNNEIMQNTSDVGASVTSAIKDGNYNTLGEIRDLQMAVNTGFANMQSCCCETNRNIDSVRFDMANYAAESNANTTAQIQKVLDALSTNRMADMQNQINALQMQNAMCGVVRYPNASTYYAGANPFCSNGCGCGNI